MIAEAQERLRVCVLNAEATGFAPCDCRKVWSELVTGNSKVVDAFFGADRCYLVLGAGQLDGPQQNPKSRDLRVFEQVAAGTPQKVVSLDWGISASSVTTIAKHYLAFLGICCSPSRMPSPLVMLMCASSAGRPLRGARSSSVVLDGQCYQTISVPRPELTVADQLSRAQLEAVGLLLEGRPHAQIARARRTSPRTVANQLASAFQRLGVSGRGQLMHALALRCQAEP